MICPIHPVLLCGGSGTRLWPLSRKSYPKQFVKLLGEESLFQSSARRILGEGFAAPSIVTGSDFRFVVIEQLPDAVLVAHKDRVQEIKAAVALLKSKGAAQAETLPRDYRPWGWYESLVLGPRFQVKRIVVNPGAALSLQSHHHRSEHWIVVAGTAKVTIDDEVKLVCENQSVYIPLGAVHRMENPGKLPLTLIEVQTGSYFGEDDIIRYEDVYARGQGAKG